jgi:hypothetical protein
MFHPQIDQAEHRRLGHLKSTKTTYTGTAFETVGTYAVPSPTTLTRPADGVALVQIKCPICRESVGVAVASERATRKARKFWLRVTLSAVTLFFAMIPATILLFVYVQNMNAQGLSVAVTAGPAMIAFYSWLYSFGFTGIRWASGTSSALRRDHKLFREDQYQRNKELFRKAQERLTEKQASAAGTASPPGADARPTGDGEG